MTTRVTVTRAIPVEGIDLLAQAGYEVVVNPEDRDLTSEELLRAAQGSDALLCMLCNRIDRTLMEAAPRCRIYANYAVGFNNMDGAAAAELSVALTNTPDVLTAATADLAWALLLAAARRVVEADRFTRQGRFENWGPKLFLGADVTGKTLGIVGAGRIGTAMALRSRGFDMNVLYCHPRGHETLERETHARRVSLDTLLAESDFVSVHVPLNEQTRHLIGRAQLQQMRPTAILINTARGPVVDEAALVEALKSRRIAAAGLDVYEREPALAAGLTELDNVVLLPHVGSATRETRSRMAVMAAENIRAFLEGKRPPNLVNPEGWQLR